MDNKHNYSDNKKEIDERTDFFNKKQNRWNQNENQMTITLTDN